jgi:hypothetical protein
VTAKALEVFDVAQLSPPTDLGSTELAISVADVERYRESFPADVRETSERPIILFDQETVRLIARRWAHGRTVQTRARWVVGRRVEAGERVVTRAHLTDTYVRHGLRRVASEAVSVVGDEHVGLVTMEHVTPPVSTKPAATESRDHPAPVEAPAWSYAWRPTAAQLVAYSGRMDPPDNIHTNPELAHEAGFRDLVVQGHHTLALTLELLVQRLRYPGPIDALVRLTRSWYVGDIALITAWPAKGDPDRWRLVASVDDAPVVLVDVRLGRHAEHAAAELRSHSSVAAG